MDADAEAEEEAAEEAEAQVEGSERCWFVKLVAGCE